MTPRNTSASDSKKPKRTNSQHIHISRPRPSPSPSSKSNSHHSSSSSSPSSKANHKNTYHPSPLAMVTTSTPSHHTGAEAHAYYGTGEYSPQTADAQGWMEPIDIDDEDLMFGGKSLSAWYEEDRRVNSMPVEEERRGRQRVRQPYEPTYHHHHHHHGHHHKSKKASSTNSSDESKQH